MLLDNIFENCREIGLVNTQYEFSELCGRRTTWFSASKARHLPISTDAAVNLSVRLKECAGSLGYKQARLAKQLSRQLLEMVTERAGRA